MTVRRTIAILGDTGTFCPILAEQLAQQPLRLLFVSGGEDKNQTLASRLERKETTAEIEFLSCEKEGCWEADIIAFTDPGLVEPALVERIKAVSTQKVVLVIAEKRSGKMTSGELARLQEWLPHSNVVRVEIDPGQKTAEVYGAGGDSPGIVPQLFRDSGYSINLKK